MAQPTLKQMLRSASGIDRRLASQREAAILAAKQAVLAPAKDETETETESESEPEGNETEGDKFNVFKVVEGERAGRASKFGLSQEEADKFISDNPDNTYEVVSDEPSE